MTDKDTKDRDGKRMAARRSPSPLIKAALAVTQGSTSFLRSQSQMLLSTKASQRPRPFIKKPNTLLGLSCLAYSLPSLLLMALMASQPEMKVTTLVWIELVGYAACGVSSFAADYMITGSQPSMWHMIDRYCATVTGVVSAYDLWISTAHSWLVRLVTACIFFSIIYCLIRSRRSRKNSEWLFWHSLWHLYGTTCVLFLFVDQHYIGGLVYTK